MATQNLKDRIARLERTQAQRTQATRTPEEEEAAWQDIIDQWHPILDGICGPRWLNRNWRTEFPYPDNATTTFRKALWLDVVGKMLMEEYRNMQPAHKRKSWDRYKAARGLAR
ncbi:MAG: hypothetical protein ACYCYO_08375 [Bacilli bacterium]